MRKRIFGSTNLGEGSKGSASGIERLSVVHRRSLKDPEAFWGPIAAELSWFEKSGPIFRATRQPPYGRWCEGWTTNLALNCLDRWSASQHRARVAYHWEGEQGERRSVTYADLKREVERLSGALASMGIGKGDRVTIYLPMIPELPVAMLATVRLGAVHSVVFGGFASHALAERIRDSGSRILITAEGGRRRGGVIELKRIADEAMVNCPTIERCIVVQRGLKETPWTEGRDIGYSDALRSATRVPPAQPVEGTHPSFILYTSGTTGKPKGAVHGTGGYMLWVYYTQQAVFGPTEADVYWCTADIGWVTGHSYIVYGPLLRGMTSVLYEGAPDYPAPGRWWELIARYRVTELYTSPTAIRAQMQLGTEIPQRFDLSSLRLLGTVGEAINPAAWEWYHQTIGGGRCPIVDTWWQTETGGIMISPQPGIAEILLKPGSATVPLAGVRPEIVDESGAAVGVGEKGYLILRSPWPGQFLTLWNDESRYRSVYFARFAGSYYAADYALRDADGYFWLLGRADEVLKVAGHRLGTIEIEDALIRHPAVAESAVIGRSDPTRGQTPVAFVILKHGHTASRQLRIELLEQVRQEIGPVAVPSALYFVEKLPKTRSAKIMRRLIRDVVEERPLGDVTTLEDEASVEEARHAYEEFKAELARDHD